jgi:S-DNA-T family DNA segregation ATPase FtsK/SpoIIIE
MLYNFTKKRKKVRKLSSLIFFVIVIYIEISTLFDNPHYIGKVGEFIGTYNKLMFGYISFVYPFFLIFIYYKIFKTNFQPKRSGEIIISFFMFFFFAIILESLITEKSGKIGNTIVLFLTPYIGIAGIWLFLCILFGVGITLILESSFEDVFFKSNLQKLKTAPASSKKTEKKKISTKEEKKDIELTEKEEKPEPDEADEKIGDVEIVKEIEENKKILEKVEKGKLEKPEDFELPKIEFLQKPSTQRNFLNENEIDKKIKELIEKLRQFKIEGDVVKTYRGPVVTTFEFKPAPHIKVSKILNLQDDLAMALKAQTIRIQAPIPGKDVVGIEIPNKEPKIIFLREIIQSDIFKNSASPLTVALGKDIVGNPFVTDLKKLPHLLIAGTTGSGKSVGINSIILSLLYRNSPKMLKLILIDPKRLEFSIYNDLPHLLTPVITKSKQAVAVLNNVVLEMERRYKIMSETKTKNIEGYNKKPKKKN